MSRRAGKDRIEVIGHAAGIAAKAAGNIGLVPGASIKDPRYILSGRNPLFFFVK